jgi:hypothetical protein
MKKLLVLSALSAAGFALWKRSSKPAPAPWAAATDKV